mgnify:CR=1 FL=1
MKLLDLTGQTALVTGASQGLGAAIARTLAALGAQVVGWDRHPPAAAADAPPGVRFEQVDVTDAQAAASAAAALQAQGVGLDILVNNAGIQGLTAPIAQQDDETWARVIDVNLTAVFRICRSFAPHMQARGRGRIINIASVAGLRGVAGAVAYSASKGGVLALSRALAKELVASGVTVNCAAPGLAETPLQSQMDAAYVERIARRIPMGRLCQPDDVAATVAWIASPACGYTTGAVFDVSGGRLAD